MDRGIPTEEVLAEMRASEPPISYLVGTPKSRLSKLEAELAACPWEQVRPGIEVKLLPYMKANFTCTPRVTIASTKSGPSASAGWENSGIGSANSRK